MNTASSAGPTSLGNVVGSAVPTGQPYPRKLIQCLDCGRCELRAANAYLCRSCRAKRKAAHIRRWVAARRATDPVYDALYRAKYAMYARREHQSHWPIPCGMCAAPIHMTKGRKRTNALCPECRNLNRRYMANLAYHRRFAA